MKYGWECWSGGMAHPYFGREGRMGMGTVFRKDGREGGPSEKNGRYPSLATAKGREKDRGIVSPSPPPLFILPFLAVYL